MGVDRPGDFAAIWEMDGVLVDTGEFHYIAVTTTNPPDLLDDADVVVDSFEDLSEDEIWDLID